MAIEQDWWKNKLAEEIYATLKLKEQTLPAFKVFAKTKYNLLTYQTTLYGFSYSLSLLYGSLLSLVCLTISSCDIHKFVNQNLHNTKQTCAFFSEYISVACSDQKIWRLNGWLCILKPELEHTTSRLAAGCCTIHAVTL